MDWVTIGDQPQTDTAWRAPLRTAVDSAQVVAFALDWRDQSDNLINEIRWAIQSGVQPFFLVHDGPQTLEGEGLVLGILATHYILTTLRPDYPEFGHHCCRALDGPDLTAEVQLAANRILAYHTRCAVGPLPMASADNDLTMADMARRPEARARALLQRLQADCAPPAFKAVAANQPSAHQAAQDYLRHHELAATAAATTAGSNPRLLDQFRSADDLLARCQPGPHELGVFLGPLLLQAAAVEAMLHDDLRRTRPDALDFNPAVVLGSVLQMAEPQPWLALQADGARLLVFDTAFLDLLYQVVTLTLRVLPAQRSEVPGGITLQLDPAALPDHLARQPSLAQGLYDCLRTYAMTGLPGASTTGAAPPELQQPLDLFLRLTCRALVALAYADLGLQGASWPLPKGFEAEAGPAAPPTPAGLATPAQAALRDRIALDYDCRSRGLIDQGSPLQSLSAVLMLHGTLHMRSQLLATLRPGSARWPVETPEQLMQRLSPLMSQVGGHMAAAGVPDADIQHALNEAWQMGAAPLQLWAHVQPQLQADAAAGQRALSAWR